MIKCSQSRTVGKDWCVPGTDLPISKDMHRINLSCVINSKKMTGDVVNYYNGLEYSGELISQLNTLLRLLHCHFEMSLVLIQVVIIPG